MQKRKKSEEKQPKTEAAPQLGDESHDEEPEIVIKDRRHWAQENADGDAEVVEAEPARPTIIDEYRTRAEEAEQKLQDYIEAYKDFRNEQEQVRQRLNRDIQRRVELQFGELVGELLQTVDTLSLALSHVEGLAEVKPLADGVQLALDGFLGTLERNGIEKVVPDGTPFDPNESEALRMDPVESKDRDGVVTETLQAGYRLGDTLIRPARVAVGRFSS